MYSPEELQGPYTAYTAANITKKNSNKEEFLKSLKISTTEKTLVVGLVLSKEPSALKGEVKDLLDKIIEGLSHLAFIQPLLVVNAEQVKHEEYEGLHVMPLHGKEQDSLALLTGVDAFTVLEEGQKFLKDFAKEAQGFGGVLLLDHSYKKLEAYSEYNPFSESGNSFFFAKRNVWNVMAMMIRIYEVFKFPYDWNTLRRTIMSQA